MNSTQAETPLRVVQIISFASTKDTMRRECNRSECALGPSHMVEQNTSMGQCSI
jgi:hypothetical protein